MKNQSPYHPAYGLPETLRFKAVRDAVETSVREAAEQNNVGMSSIYRCMSDMEINKGAGK